MSDITITPYSSDHCAQWDEFVRNSRNGTFLLHRGYMDYHADRFSDSSLMFHQGNRLIAVLPANLGTDGILYSHQGLTYGGLIMPYRGVSAATVLSMFDALRDWCSDNGIHRLVYKAIPHIYHRYPSEEDVYALFRNGAVMSNASISSTIDLRAFTGFDATNRRNVRSAFKSGISVCVSDDYESFWEILSQRLESRYGVAPVHSLGEMKLLANCFPDNIRLYAAQLDGKMIAGTVAYITDTCVHLQYIATSQRGRDLKAFAAIADTLVREFGDSHRYMDFGTCDDRNGLNVGLLEQKNRLAGRGTVYTSYCLKWS